MSTVGLSRLRAAHEAALRPLAAATNLYNRRQCIAALADPAHRLLFAIALGRFARALEPLFDEPQAQGFRTEMRWLGQVLLGAAARYDDDRIAAALGSGRVRRLVQEAIVAEASADPAPWVESPRTQVPTRPAAARVLYDVLTAAEALAAAEARPRYGAPLDPARHQLAEQLAALVSPQCSESELCELLRHHLRSAGYADEQAGALVARAAARLLSRPSKSGSLS